MMGMKPSLIPRSTCSIGSRVSRPYCRIATYILCPSLSAPRRLRPMSPTLAPIAVVIIVDPSLPGAHPLPSLSPPITQKAGTRPLLPGASSRDGEQRGIHSRYPRNPSTAWGAETTEGYGEAALDANSNRGDPRLQPVESVGGALRSSELREGWKNMCGRYTLKTQPNVLAERFDLDEFPSSPLPPSYNIAPRRK